MTADARAAGAPALPLVLLLCGSGAVALVYETLWMRLFTARFGAGAPAAAATVAAMFAGMALGSAWFGRRAPRWRAPLRAYGLLELGAVAGATLVPWIVRASGALAPALHRLGAHSPALFLALQTALVFAALLAPTFLLGGTLPAATQAVDDGRGSGARWSGALYAANTAGAIGGVLLVPFVLLPLLGAARAYALALAAGAALGLVALVLRTPGGAPAAPPGPRRAERSAAQPAAPERAFPPAWRGLAWLAFASGFTLLGLEVVWMRMLAQVHPSSVHAFALVLAVFLAALALGAGVGAELVRRGADPRRALARSWVAAGLLTLAAPGLFVRLTDGLAQLASGARAGTLVVYAAASFGPATLCAGIVLPVLLGHAARAGGPAAPAVGRLLAANTAGSVLGPLVATFALFPLLGTWGSAVALGAAVLVLALVTGARGRPGIAPVVAACAAVLLARDALGLPRVHVASRRGEELVWLLEGSHGIAAAVRDAHSLRLKLDNSYTLGGTATAGDERMLGHVPLLLAPSTRRVAFLGLGTGITASAALRHPVEQVTVLELVPEVAAGAREVFAQANLDLCADPRVEIVVADARSHLAAAPVRYDVIVGDLVVPWRRGESALFTREHFESARGALAEDGLFCQWLPAYQTSEEELRIVVATFLDVFPEAQLWRADFDAERPALGLVAHAGPRPLDPRAVDERVRARSAELVRDNRYLAHPAGLWLYLVGPLDAGLPWVAATRRNTQDLPWLELLGARGGDAPAFTGAGLLGFLDEVRARPGPPTLALDDEHRRWSDLGLALFRASTLDRSGDEESARTLAFATLAGLPAEIRASLGDPAGGEDRR